MLTHSRADQYVRFSDVSDEELAGRALCDSDAMDAIIDRYRRIVVKKTHGYYIVGSDYDDVFQEGMIGLFKAVRDFNPTRSNFRTFAEMCIARQLITAIKKATRKKHEMLNRSLSFDAASYGAEENGREKVRRQLLAPVESRDPLFYIEREQEAREFYDQIMSNLSPLEADVFMSYMRSRSYVDISQELRCGMKRVDNALQRAKRKLGIAIERLQEVS
jgi:RNA polymerase sporulation-specific sigma factor